MAAYALPPEELCIIERYGEFVRIGVEFKWVEFIKPDKKMSKAELLALIAEMDRERTQ